MFVYLIIVCLLFYFWPYLFVFLHRFTFFLKRLVSIKFKQWWSMFNFTNINKSNNHISPQTIEHKTYLDISLWVQTQRYGGVKPVNGISLWKLYLKPQYKYKQINLKKNPAQIRFQSKNLHRFASNQKTCTDSLPIKRNLHRFASNKKDLHRLASNQKTCTDSLPIKKTHTQYNTNEWQHKHGLHNSRVNECFTVNWQLSKKKRESVG